MSPNKLDELKELLGETVQAKGQKELNWLLESIQEKVDKKGQNWVKQNRSALLRQWEYVRSLF